MLMAILSTNWRNLTRPACWSKRASQQSSSLKISKIPNILSPSVFPNLSTNKITPWTCTSQSWTIRIEPRSISICQAWARMAWTTKRVCHCTKTCWTT
jgi:hypothetical protein